MKVATKVNFISKFGAREFHQTTDETNVIYNGLEQPTHCDEAHEMPLTDLLYVGTASHRKRVNVLPFIVRNVRDHLERDVTLRVVGFDRSSWPEMFDVADRLGVADSILCEGLMTSHEVKPFYKRSRILVVPSAYEGLPMVIGEAQRAGLPCVATDVCAHSEVISHGHNGLLVALDSVDEFAGRICELLSDGELHNHMSQYATVKAEESFSLPQQFSAYCEIYDRLHGRATPHKGCAVV